MFLMNYMNDQRQRGRGDGTQDSRSSTDQRRRSVSCFNRVILLSFLLSDLVSYYSTYLPEFRNFPFFGTNFL